MYDGWFISTVASFRFGLRPATSNGACVALRARWAQALTANTVDAQATRNVTNVSVVEGSREEIWVARAQLPFLHCERHGKPLRNSLVFTLNRGWRLRAHPPLPQEPALGVRSCSPPDMKKVFNLLGTDAVDSYCTAVSEIRLAAAHTTHKIVFMPVVLPRQELTRGLFPLDDKASCPVGRIGPVLQRSEGLGRCHLSCAHRPSIVHT